MNTSPQWRDGKFRNPQPLWNDYLGAVRSVLRRNPHRVPKAGDVPVVHPSPGDLLASSSQDLKVTWLGHSTVYLDLGGIKVLTDPVWGERTSPVSGVGPKRWYASPLALEALPRPDVVVISHDHYDHLDRPTIERMQTWDVRFVTPLGVGQRLRGWGIDANRITELDWWQAIRVGGLEITCTPARHASGRGLFDKDKTLWGGYAFRTAEHRVYFSGDTGMFEGFRDIGARLGPFDLTLLEVGAYGQAWPDWHLGPEQAVEAHRMVKGRAMMPIHWGLFDLAAHGWTEPVERLLSAVDGQTIDLRLPKPGEPFSLGEHPGPRAARWWPVLPWQTAGEVPIRATPMGLRPQPQS